MDGITLLAVIEICGLLVITNYRLISFVNQEMYLLSFVTL